MTTASIRAEVAKTIHEAGLSIWKAREFWPGMPEPFEVVQVRDMPPLVLGPGSMLIVTVDDSGSRTFILQDFPAESLTDA